MDIVERLRKPVSKDDPYICTNTDIQPEIKYDLLRSQAADEIERLREALDKLLLEAYALTNSGVEAEKLAAIARAALRGDER